MTSIDETDKKIIAEYLKDARVSYREVAKRLQLAVGTVLTRTKKLENDGIIESYSAVLNHDKLGYEIIAISEITVSKGKLTEVENAIAKLSPTCAVYDVTGENDVILISKFKSRDEMSNFTKKLLSMSNVERTNSRIVLNTIKEDFRLSP
ncbi:MAG: Lrp/AsnC family transcriptional regulator [Nitrososphaerales archaeon]|nr:Lrp/AsnC family transcriptional regulator [Nitrososphaerales archaeon]|tara:strand:+ start:7191 stop:7640 length:450 start_codon:yes stop_codon:yes gene_type:complete